MKFKEAWKMHKECVLSSSNLSKREELIAKRSFINGILQQGFPETELYETTLVETFTSLEDFETLNK